MKRILRQALMVSILWSAAAAVRADVVKNPSADLLWMESFDPLVLNADRTTGWGLGEPPEVALSAPGGVLTAREIGARSWGYINRYVPYDLVLNGRGFPFLQVRLLEAPGPVTIANASTGGRVMINQVRGPGLYSFDLRHSAALVRNKQGVFGLSLCFFGPDGHEPGPETRIDWIRTSALDTDIPIARLEDAQAKGEPGHGFASPGDRIRFSLNTSARCKKVTFRVLDLRTGRPVALDGRTEFPGSFDPDSLGQTWLAEIPVGESPAAEFRTWTLVKGSVEAGTEHVAIVAELEGGPYERLISTPAFGFDLAAGAAGGSGAADLQTLLQGASLLDSTFDNGDAPGWRFVAGDQWVVQDGQFGEVSDTPGAGDLGNWAAAGEDWWADYRIEAEVARELDGMGKFLLAARFKDPRNYYALEWSRGEGSGDILRLIRCVEGESFEIARAAGLRLDTFPFRLGLSVSGDYLAASLNGEQALAGYAADFATGPMAIGAKSRKVLVDRVRVSRIVSEARVSRFLRDLSIEYALAPRYFLRDTGPMKLPFRVANRGKEALGPMQVEIAFESERPASWGGEAAMGGGAAALFPPLREKIERLKPGESRTLEFAIDTRLVRRGEYRLRTRVSAPRLGLVKEGAIPFGIARNWNPDRFNYFTWGLPFDEAGMRDYAEHGHTLGFVQVGGRGSELEWKHLGRPVPEAERIRSQGLPPAAPAPFSPFDYCLKYGIVGGVNLQSNAGNHFPEDIKGEFKGNAHPGLLPYHPKFAEFSVNFARTYAERFGAYPACGLFGINTETEFELQPDFSATGLERAKRLFGGPPPEGAIACDGLPGDKVPGLVTDGLVDDEHPVARYYRWFWNEGEGWNLLARDMADAIREVNPRILAFHDPAARNPSIRDRNPGVHHWDWTYTNPNALTVPYKTEVLRAMAKPPLDTICNYVQVLWKQGAVSPRDECPSPAILRLGLLYSTSRPVLAGHWNTDWMRDAAHRDRWEAIRDLHETFWRPLGPVLTRLTLPPREVAFLLSYNQALFQSRDRQSLWVTEYILAAWHEAFMRAGLPVDIVFEEDVAEGKLARYKAVFIPAGELLGRKAHARLVEFAKGGGRVVANRTLGYEVPGVELLQSDLQGLQYRNWSFTNPNHRTAQELVDLVRTAVEEIARVFAEPRSRAPSSDSFWLVVNERRHGDVRYVFAVNDHRSAGTQVGQYGVLLENGEPLTASVLLPGVEGPRFVYHLAGGGRVEATAAEGVLRWSHDYPPASAALFAVLEQEIAGLELTVPAAPVAAGGEFAVSARLLDPKGRPVRGRLPLKLTIRDARGAESEYSDVFAFEDGTFARNGWIALNDPPGTWSVRVEDLASGRSAVRYFSVHPKP